MSESETRVLIIIFDALRPEFVTPELMPNLTRFANDGVRYTDSHSTFPTETRVNQSAVITGCYPTRHGLVANKFIDPVAAPDTVFDTGNEEALTSAIARLDGKLLHMPTLGQRLAKIEKSYASLSTGTAGGGRLINHVAEENNNFRLALNGPFAASPDGIMDRITERIGPIPKFELPATKWITYAVDCYLEFIEKEIAPDVMLLWLSEPDESFHHLGIGSDGSLTAIRHVDREFGRILERQHDQINSGCLQIITLSDHGQISLAGQPLDLEALFKAGGFTIGSTPEKDQQGVVIVDNGGGIWLNQPDPQLLGELVKWLQHQHWCGPLFTRDGDGGTLRHEDVGLAHARAPDIAMIFRHEDSDNTWGIAGETLHDAGYPVGGGCHGGLSRYELHNFLAMSGSCFGRSRNTDLPAGNIDITPTVMRLFGEDISGDVDGRILVEGLRDKGDAGSPRDHTVSSTNTSGAITHLAVTQLGSTRYLTRGWVTTS